MHSINNNYYYTDKEIKAILDSIIIIIDSGEQENKHIIDYFEKKKIAYKIKKINTADYSFAIPAIEGINERFKIFDNLAVIERKRDVSEIAGNLKEDRKRLENEFIRGRLKRTFQILIEESNGYENILNGNYRSEYKPASFLATIQSFASRYNFNFIFLDKKLTGNYIYHYFYYYLRNYLLNKLY